MGRAWEAAGRGGTTTEKKSEGKEKKIERMGVEAATGRVARESRDNSALEAKCRTL